MRKRLLGLLIAFFTSCLIVGCSSADADNVYDYASEALGEATDEELELLAGGRLGVNFDGSGIGSGLNGDGSFGGGIKGGLYGMLTALCNSAKQYGPFVIVGSVLFGIILLRLAPKAIKVRRTAWVVFIIGIPVVVLFLIFGTAILADAFAS